MAARRIFRRSLLSPRALLVANTSPPAPAPEPWQPAPHPPRPWLAALLSVLHVVLGYLYLGMARTAIALWVVLVILGAAVGWVASRWVSVVGFAGAVILALVVRIAVAVHCWRLARAHPTRPRPHGVRLALTLVAAAALALVADAAFQRWVHAHVEQPFRIPSGAMEPAVLAGDWIYTIPDRERAIGEDRVVVYARNETMLIKRVAGVAGDTVEMRGGRLFRDGRAVAEPWAHSEGDPYGDDSTFAWQRTHLVDAARAADYHPTADDWGPLLVPTGHVFLLGDNRHHAQDDRFLGFTPVSAVLARPTFVYWSWSADSSRPRWNRIGLAVR